MKPHGMPPLGSDLLHMHKHVSSTQKRSYHRAFRRACKHGYCWYRGQRFKPEHFSDLYSQRTPPDADPTPHAKCSPSNHAHAPSKNRFTVLQWNAGGLSSARFHEFKLWASQQRVDVISIAETRWTLDEEWQDPNWIVIHTGFRDQADKANGVMLMLSKRVFSIHNVAWQVIVPGRLLHVRLFAQPRTIDIISGYQHVHKTASIPLQNSSQMVGSTH